MNSAIALIVNNRFFYGWGKSQRLRTAWCLAGAKLYQPDISYYKEDKQKLEKKGHQVDVREVQS